MVVVLVLISLIILLLLLYELKVLISYSYISNRCNLEGELEKSIIIDIIVKLLALRD